MKNGIIRNICVILTGVMFLLGGCAQQSAERLDSNAEGSSSNSEDAVDVEVGLREAENSSALADAENSDVANGEEGVQIEINAEDRADFGDSAGTDGAAAEENGETEEADGDETTDAYELDLDKIMASVIQYYASLAPEENKGEYVIFDTENVDKGNRVEFIVRYRPSEEEEEAMIEDGSGPLANIYVTTVSVAKATGDVTDETGEKIIQGSAVSSEDDTDDEDAASGDFSFADVADKQFIFCSGAGGWHTSVSIDEDGYYEGLFIDSDMGDTGEGYPNGTQYYCQFEGHFTEPVKVNDYKYEFEIESMDIHKPAKNESIEDGVKTIFADPYGMEDSKKFCIFLPGTPTKEIPNEILGWLPWLDSNDKNTAIDCYVIGNLDKQYGFSQE